MKHPPNLLSVLKQFLQRNAGQSWYLDQIEREIFRCGYPLYDIRRGLETLVRRSIARCDNNRYTLAIRPFCESEPLPATPLIYYPADRVRTGILLPKPPIMLTKREAPWPTLPHHFIDNRHPNRTGTIIPTPRQAYDVRDLYYVLHDDDKVAAYSQDEISYLIPPTFEALRQRDSAWQLGPPTDTERHHYVLTENRADRINVVSLVIYGDGSYSYRYIGNPRDYQHRILYHTTIVMPSHPETIIPAYDGEEDLPKTPLPLRFP